MSKSYTEQGQQLLDEQLANPQHEVQDTPCLLNQYAQYRHNQTFFTKKSSKKLWTKHQDHLLRTVVSENGPHQWNNIAKLIPQRNGKQCRQRWFNHLSHDVVKKQWTQAQQWTLFLLVNNFGCKWSKIKQNFPGRSDNEIKNHWNCKMKRKKTQFAIKLKHLLNNPFESDKHGQFFSTLQTNLTKQQQFFQVSKQQQIARKLLNFQTFKRNLDEQASQQEKQLMRAVRQQMLLQEKKIEEEANAMFQEQLRMLRNQRLPNQSLTKKQIKQTNEYEDSDEYEQQYSFGEQNWQENQDLSLNIDFEVKNVHLQASKFTKHVNNYEQAWNIFQQDGESHML